MAQKGRRGAVEGTPEHQVDHIAFWTAVKVLILVIILSMAIMCHTGASAVFAQLGAVGGMSALWRVLLVVGSRADIFPEPRYSCCLLTLYEI